MFFWCGLYVSEDFCNLPSNGLGTVIKDHFPTGFISLEIDPVLYQAKISQKEESVVVQMKKERPPTFLGRFLVEEVIEDLASSGLDVTKLKSIQSDTKVDVIYYWDFLALRVCDRTSGYEELFFGVRYG